MGESLQNLHLLRKLKIVKRDTEAMAVIFTGPSWKILGGKCPLLEALELDLPIWDQKEKRSILGNYVEVRTFASPRVSY
jgi:hypothetical protein